eukprot:TRINITY_DN8916_c0_g1::TRINITY_DN8916_c0_g1_i1::g.24619::m.24619 TRINITY_DN8916_c0_g1::TRINITY_DN8916_c0_g1_i1::g.24619  ORF type:complete len:432 (+),score=56.52,sp/P36876/2ABA_RAT/22.15/7e-08,WD40/PF00400.27/2.3,WD40/PF00400.27/2.3e+02,WD40/PF00400.27/2.3e+02,WD40/PF00400.27/3e+02 TRINITY_DN8916_c0_g1_i1:88-1383(+)
MSMQLGQAFGYIPDNPTKYALDCRKAQKIQSLKWDPDGSYLASIDKEGLFTIFHEKSAAIAQAKVRVSPKGFAKLCSQLEPSNSPIKMEWTAQLSNKHRNVLISQDHRIELWRLNLAENSVTPQNPLISCRMKHSWNDSNLIISKSSSPGKSDSLHSIDINVDGYTFLSASSYNIAWHRMDERSDENIMLISRKANECAPITSAKFHPHCDSVLAYSDAQGYASLVDTRISADTRRATIPCGELYAGPKNLLRSSSSVSFGPCRGAASYTLLVRDLITERVYDIRKPNVTQHLSIVAPALHPAYQDYITHHDSRFLSRPPLPSLVTTDNQYTVTGMYTGFISSYHISKEKRYYMSPLDQYYASPDQAGGYRGKSKLTSLGQYQMSDSVSAMAVHPSRNAVAVAFGTAFCIVDICKKDKLGFFSSTRRTHTA